MKNGLKMKWTLNAQNELNAIYDYLEENWTSKEIKNFSMELERVLSTICKFPYIFPVSLLKNSVRRCVISKQTSLYYKIGKNQIIIISLFDNRKNPFTSSSFPNYT